MQKLKFLFILSIVGLFFIAIGARNLSQPLKVGIVDSQKIMESYKEAVAAMDELDNLYEQWDRQTQKMRNEIQKKQDYYRDRVLVLSEESRYERQKEIQKLVNRLQQYQQDKFGQDGEASQKENELMDPIRKKIQETIREFAQSEGFNYILESSSGSDLLFASDDQPDLTDRIIQKLNRAY